jgi:hypothetical protein
MTDAPVPATTWVIDQADHEELSRIEGSVVLPVGSLVQLSSKQAAIVAKVELRIRENQADIALFVDVQRTEDRPPLT